MQDQIGWYIVRVENPARADAVAKRMDALFANSPAETKTATEKVFASDFAKQVGDIGAIMTAIAAVVILFILFVAGNAMAQSIRERTNELAVLKTLGFNDRKVLAMVLLESLLVAVLGGGLGLLVASLLIAQGDPTGGFLPIFYFPPRDLVFGCVLVLALGVLSGLVPALQAGRLKIVDALRRT
jgi:putative ABC transport system permease protein